jgi:hypothetical protein
VNSIFFVGVGGGEAKHALHYAYNQAVKNTWQMGRVGL